MTYLLEVTLEPIEPADKPPLPDTDFDNPTIPYDQWANLDLVMGTRDTPWVISGARFDRRIIENVPDPE